jgi:ribulose-phosphate 3-epimerase
MRPRKVKIAPSILASDFTRLGEQVTDAVRAGADYIHVDVMDGHFVPNISIGIPVVASLRRITRIPLDVHLMIDRPENFVKEFAAAGADILTIHVEACTHLHSTLSIIRGLGMRAGVSLNPATPLHALDEALEMVDLVLVMSVNPGFGGQEFIPATLGKIARLKQIIYNGKIKAEIEVDGGITAKTAPAVVKAGANVLVTGSAVFASKMGIKAAMQEIRKSVS